MLTPSETEKLGSFEKIYSLIIRVNSIYSSLNKLSKTEILDSFLEIGGSIFYSDFSVIILKDTKYSSIPYFSKNTPHAITKISNQEVQSIYKDLENKQKPVIKKIAGFGEERKALLTRIKNNKNEVLGFTAFVSKNKFSESDTKISKIFVNLLNTTLQIKIQLNEFKLLNNVSRSLTETTDLNQTLNLILHSIKQIFNSEYVHIIRLISVLNSNDHFEIMATTDTNINQGTRFKSQEGFSGWIVANNKFLVVPNLDREVKKYDGFTENNEKVILTPKSLKSDENEKSFLGVPLRYKGFPIGALVIADTKQSNAFDAFDDPDLLQMFADQAAVTLENIRVHNEEKSRHELILEKATLTNPSAIAMSFVHDARHSMNNINAYFSSLLHYVSDSRKSEPAFKELEKTLISESDKLKELFKSLVRYARKDELNIELHPLNEILSKIQFLMSIRLKTINCRITYKPNSLNQILIPCDNAELEQLFINLFNNSIAAINEKQNQRSGLIDITVSDPDIDNIKIEFFDNGMGIKEDHLPFIFDLFFSTKKDGTGFGLPICQRIVRDHHKGTISVYSAYGEYTKFVITFPKKNQN